MPTSILRPDDLVASTGFNVSGPTLISKISDNNLGTSITQNNETALIQCNLTNLDESISDTSLISVVVSIIGFAGRSGSSTLNVQLLTGMSTSTTNVQETTLNFTGVGTTQSTSAYTSNLKSAVINDMGLNLVLGESGMDITEVFITAGKILLQKGKIIL